MGYLHIDNLYKNQRILQFKECYAFEKIHGTSANISYVNETVNLFPGGESYDKFAKLFDKQVLKEKFIALGHDKVHVYGEAYGGKQQGMSDTYGTELRFMVFEVKIGDAWLDVPDAEDVANNLGLEFNHYVRCSTELEELNKQRDADSVVAVRRGMGTGKSREGIVLLPLTQTYTKNGERIIAKHKRDEMRETKSVREVNPEKFKILEDAKAIAEEWVTPMRLNHVLDKMPHELSMEDVPRLIHAMVEDVYREAKGEIVESKPVQAMISHKTVALFKEYLQNKMKQDEN